LAAIYALYGAWCVAGQRWVWPLLASDRLIDGRALIATLLAALGTIAAAAYAAPLTSESLARRLTVAFAPTRRVPTLLVIAFAVFVPVIIADVVLDRFQNSGDEFAYFFQARMFAHGQLWAPAPPLGDTFVPYRTWIIGDKWLSQYPPGWPLAMAAAIMAGIPAWCVNAVLGGISVAALLTRQWGHRDHAIVLMVVVLYVMTPFYLMNAGSYYSHMLPALLITLLCLMCLWYQRERRTLALIISGVLVGLIGLTRYFSLILLLPALLYWWIKECRHDRLRVLGVVVVSGIPFLAILMIYQDWITGSPFHNTYSLISNDDTFVSFLPGAVTRGALLTFYRFGELTLWAVPLLVPTYLFCMASKLKNRSIAFYDLIFPSFVIGYVFFADLGGNRYGPRYYFEAFPMMFVTLLSAAPQAGQWARELFHRRLGPHLTLTSLVYLTTALPFTAVAYHRQVVSREEPYRLVAARGLHDAIVIIESSSGRGLDAEDLARNDADLDGSVLFARAGTTPDQLRQLYPKRSIWAYDREDPRKPGNLKPVP